MDLFKKRIEMSDSVMIFVNSIMADSKKIWPDILMCIKNNGYDLEDEDESYGVWFTGLLALDTLYAYQVLDNKVADSIYKNVGYYFDFRIEELKDWPPIIKEMYDFFSYSYFRAEEKYKKNPNPNNMPPVTTSMTLLLGIIIGYSGLKNSNDYTQYPHLPQKMFNDFLEIVLKTLGRWEKINKQYKINWLL